ncbi:hypothetical protein CDAR_30891 [Caerostris darwini]|uniref:Uncharacterized protein n=1 Tax=Caerostris darwini TaxID=1538125 RepID=A0AAV4NUR4_9ARAC|nr:hypothetical protein CDAR_30891 [Caerostris darwini]
MPYSKEDSTSLVRYVLKENGCAKYRRTKYHDLLFESEDLSSPRGRDGLTHRIPEKKEDVRVVELLRRTELHLSDGGRASQIVSQNRRISVRRLQPEIERCQHVFQKSQESRKMDRGRM